MENPQERFASKIRRLRPMHPAHGGLVKASIVRAVNSFTYGLKQGR
ncbi:hypothetical protein KvSKV_09770 [Ketogulonicigenium vulgare]|nr:hypothetical protein KvSKV_09770 [Ketogulonicigenium vulgare]